MKTRSLVSVLCAFVAATMVAQTEKGRAPGQESSPAPATRAAEDRAMPSMMSSSSEMDNMARSVTASSDMCRMMMGQQMRMMPIYATIGAVLGILVTTALILFIALEIRLLKFLGLRLRKEGAAPPVTGTNQRS